MKQDLIFQVGKGKSKPTGKAANISSDHWKTFCEFPTAYILPLMSAIIQKTNKQKPGKYSFLRGLSDLILQMCGTKRKTGILFGYFAPCCSVEGLQNKRLSGAQARGLFSVSAAREDNRGVH